MVQARLQRDDMSFTRQHVFSYDVASSHKCDHKVLIITSKIFPDENEKTLPETSKLKTLNTNIMIFEFMPSLP